jgi:succinoglycan biosynthesis transport protein ExoP
MSYESQAARDARIDLGAVLSAVVVRLPRIVLVTVVLLGLALVLTMFMTRLYESSASILVEPRSNAYTRSLGEQAPPLTGSDAGVVSSQIELIKSRDTLRAVIDQLDLRNDPEFNGSSANGFSPLGIVSQLLGRKSTPASVDEVVLTNLYDRLTVVQERDSRIISVLVRSGNPQRAAEIANAIANAHVTRRASLSLADTAEASGWLGDEIAKLRVSVTEAETAVANFKVNNDLFIGANNTSLLDQQLTTISSQISTAQERKNAAVSRAALIRAMLERGQPIDGVADVRQSAVILQLSQEKARLQGEKAQRSATLLGNHPTIQALNAQIRELDSQIAIEGRRVAEALDAEAQIESDLEASLLADLARAKASASTATQDTVTLDSLQREAKAQRDLLEGYLQRYNEAASRVDVNSALPDVRVVSLAAPAVAPASPKTTLILLAVGIVALASQIGAIVFGELISGRAIVPGAPLRQRDPFVTPAFGTQLVDPEEVSIDDLEARVAALEPDFVPPAPLVEDDDGLIEEDLPVQMQTPPVVDQVARDAARLDIQRFMRNLKAEKAEEAADLAVELAAEPERTTAFAPKRRPLPPLVRATELVSDLVLGRTRVLILVAYRDSKDCEALAEELVGDAINRGMSVALVDAGSGKISDEPGVTDLSTDEASFGEVVHKSSDNSFAEVPWGQGTVIAPSSNKPLTLVEALGDIYEVVVINTGRIGRRSSLPMFDGIEARLMLVAGPGDDVEDLAATRDRLVAAGFANCELAAAPTRVAA